MDVAFHIVIIGGLIVVMLVAVLVPVMIVALVVRGSRKRAKGIMSQEELQLVQEIYTSLTDMERRIESLETILLDRSKERLGP